MPEDKWHLRFDLSFHAKSSAQFATENDHKLICQQFLHFFGWKTRVSDNLSVTFAVETNPLDVGCIMAKGNVAIGLGSNNNDIIKLFSMT